MRRAAFVLAFGLAGFATVVAGPALAQDRWVEADRRIAALLADPAKPVSGVTVIVLADGREVFATAHGKAVIDPADPARERPLTLDSVVRVASISKLPVGMAAMKLVEEGRLDLDADLSGLLGFPFRNPHYPDRAITPRMLLAHTSSLRDGAVYALPVQHTLEELVRPNGPFDADGTRWAKPEAGQDRGPGAFFTYTNLNYGVLATVLERITGERFDVTVERLILRPAGIAGAFDVRRLDDDAFARLAPLYRLVDGAWSARVDDLRGVRPDGMVSPFGVAATQPLSAYAPGRNGTTLSPQGGLRASTRDLARLLRMMIGRGAIDGTTVLKHGTMDAMLAPQWIYDPAANGGAGNGDSYHGLMRQYGLGVHCTRHEGGPGAGDRWIDATDGPRLCGHFAEAYGLFGGLFFAPREGWGFVYLITGTSAAETEAASTVSTLTVWEAAIAGAVLHGLGRDGMTKSP